MSESIHLHFDVSGEDFTRAGEASGKVKKTMKQLGIPAEAIRKVAIAMYEGEINMVIHAGGGEADVDITPESVNMTLTDHGPGIADIEQARTPLFTTGNEERSGMGFTIMESFMDKLTVKSVLGRGTTVSMKKKLAARRKRGQ